MEATMTANVSFTSIDRFFSRLAHSVWGMAIAIKHRRELAQLADRDDRMLDDIGLTRGDLYDASRAFLGRPDPDFTGAHETSMP